MYSEASEYSPVLALFIFEKKSVVTTPVNQIHKQVIEIGNNLWGSTALFKLSKLVFWTT